MTDDPNETVGSNLATFLFHECYHVGQTGCCGEWQGTGSLKTSARVGAAAGQRDSRTGGQADRRTGGQADRRTGGQADRRTGGQAEANKR